MDATEPGHLLCGRYRLTAIIGRGGMGIVWLGHDEMLDRDVAVKEIIWPPHLTEAEQLLACRRATREAQMAGRLSHHNVVRIYDIVEQDGHPCIVMEYLPYRSLRELVEADGPLPPVRAAEVGLGVLAALQAAHAEGILHRDVKPANILVGADGRVVLTDFGIARSADSPTLTGTGALLGSPAYIAPERARGGTEGAATATGDMWGLGASLYVAVEGHPPFERDSVLATLTAVVVDEPAEAVHAGPLAPVLSGLLRKDPVERLDAGATERLLRQVVADDAASAGTTEAAESLAGDTSEFTAQDEAVAVAAAASGDEAAVADGAAAGDGAAGAGHAEGDAAAGDAAAPGGVSGTGPNPVIAAPGPGSAPDPSPTAEPEPAGALARPRGSRRPLALLAALVVVAAGVTGFAFYLTGSPGQPASAGTAPRPSASRTSAPASPVVSPSASAATSPAGSPSASSPAVSPSATGTAPASPTTPASGGYGALPAGYYRFTNSTGFSIGVPTGWRISHQGHYVYITDPADSGIYLLIDQSDDPKSDPLADWEQQEANRKSTYQDYQRIRLTSVSYPQAEKAADWEFTYVKSGVPLHVLNRNVLANAKHAYALYWATPESDWSTDYHFFQAFASTFRPAAA